ncbi:hypothetical protein SAMD00019534_014910 [Acytostelium subglobosum LB1]|uniref:hypothetical protein n=1 Tax=Acytostelium subglobosum LB1 TaxID=1410327 RepID=UPI0006447E7A|nr:hypothetical protein SAMD00019534_014910 [Acytostelium subglobosum LB1]GAM18316.1 hypothetical protein SAMD00019534_014910 [Acytostelium subglobosum LB1]|eukprot:XP_012757536.1 hypothetical protein SAMD00019534_014910 [Acytostelium subglobosum LB1]
MTPFNGHKIGHLVHIKHLKELTLISKRFIEDDIENFLLSIGALASIKFINFQVNEWGRYCDHNYKAAKTSTTILLQQQLGTNADPGCNIDAMTFRYRTKSLKERPLDDDDEDEIIEDFWNGDQEFEPYEEGDLNDMIDSDVTTYDYDDDDDYINSESHPEMDDEE